MMLVIPGHVVFMFTIDYLKNGRSTITPVFAAVYLTITVIQVIWEYSYLCAYWQYFILCWRFKRSYVVFSPVRLNPAHHDFIITGKHRRFHNNRGQTR